MRYLRRLNRHYFLVIGNTCSQFPFFNFLVFNFPSFFEYASLERKKKEKSTQKSIKRSLINAMGNNARPIIFQNMLQYSRFKNLGDSERIKLQELMESVPNSVGQFAEGPNTLTHSPWPPEQNNQNLASKKKTARNRSSIGLQSTPVLYQNSQLPSEVYNDKSTRSILHNQRGVQSGFTKCQSISQYSGSNSNERNDFNKLQNNQQLREIIKKYKIKSIVSNFVTKLKRTSISNHPIEFNPKNDRYKGYFWTETGVELPQSIENFLSLLTVVQTFVLCFVASMCFVFQHISSSQFIWNFQMASFLLCLAGFVLNLVTVKSNSGKKLKIYVEIWSAYAKGDLFIDSLTLFALLLNLILKNQQVVFCLAVAFFKLPQALDSIERLQVSWIKNFYNEQYWSLIKIFISNFCFAHIISILLTAMTRLSPEQNWMTEKGIQDSSWQEQYIWSYYWANTIMLTIGFGDIVASNYKEAFALVFIQTFSCLIFAYNINCIGSLIKHIQSQDAQRSKKSKIFKKLTDQNHLNEDLSWKINNYIEENAQLRKRFNFQEEKQFITSLPVELKKQYLKESNKKIFENIEFFKSFVSKTLYNLAQKIQMRVSHPDQVIQRIDDDYNLIILKAGQIGFYSKKSTFTVKDFIMDSITINEKDQPYLLNLDFIMKKRPQYEIKSVEYSIFYFLDYDKFIQAIKDSPMDYEYYCSLRDKMKNVPDQFQLFKCQKCEGKHLKATCPRLHYIPYNQTVIHKHIYKEKTSKNAQMAFNRRYKNRFNAFKVYKKATMHAQKLGSLALQKRRHRNYLNVSAVNDHSQASLVTHETQITKEMKKIQQTYLNFTYEAIKEEINKLKRSDTEEDEVWVLKLDQLYDFNGYFCKDNPSNIYYPSHENRQSLGNDFFLKNTVIDQIRNVFGSRFKGIGSSGSKGPQIQSL